MDNSPQPDPDAIKMFVGQVPHSYGEKEIRELFEVYGPVYEVVIHRNKQTQESMGCCFLVFFHRADALAARTALHGVKILSGRAHPIQMHERPHAQDLVQRKLYVGAISQRTSEKDLEAMFSPFGKIEECVVMRSPLMSDGSVMRASKGSAFITFASPSSAFEAIKALHESQTMEGCTSQLVVMYAKNQGRIKKNEAKDGKGSMRSPPIIFPLEAAIAAANQLLPQNNRPGLPNFPILMPNYSMLSGAGVVQPNVMSMQGNAPAFNPALFAQQQPLQLQQQMQQKKLLDSLVFMQQQQAAAAAAAKESAMRGVTGGFNPQLPPPQNEALMIQQQQRWLQELQQPQPKPQMGMNGINQASMPMDAASFFAANPPLPQPQPLLPELQGLRKSKGLDMCKLFVFYLPRSFADYDLHKCFAPFGNVVSAEVFLEKETCRSKGYGFVSFDNPHSAAAALSAMNGFEVEGRRPSVEYSHHNGARGSAHPYRR